MPFNSVKEEIEHLLKEGLAPSHLEVLDESWKHAGHREAGDATESHFKVIISSDKIKELSLLQQHRKINHLLQSLLREKIHALQIEII